MDANNGIYILDLNFLNEPFAIASFLIESEDGLILIESGPESTFSHLQQAIEYQGFDWRDVKHVLLTHIHFDHAGAAWKFALNGAKIYVHPIGLPHLNQPERLWNSAKMIYKENMDTLWGRMEAIEAEYLIPADDGDVIKIGGLEFKVLYTPGHAVHHNAYELNGAVFTGDVAGVKINNGPVVPPCPPPDIHIEGWKKSIQKIRDVQPRLLYLTHFGIIDEPDKHFDELEKILDDWASWIKPFFDAGISAEEILPQFIAYSQSQLLDGGVSKKDLQHYEYANPSFMSVYGLLRYWKLKTEGRFG
ncbi:MAG: MBL fold metallo-hydrolase [Chitinophagales bacterium]|nr:MBL fold metallo-hydrolase [Chitinophagales bacterium]MCZ2394827.1 MBL fold metallo-hydrolase [Chitinophagales bacterium]